LAIRCLRIKFANRVRIGVHKASREFLRVRRVNIIRSTTIGLQYQVYLVIILGLYLANAGVASAQTFTVLHNFTGGANDGQEPIGALIQSGNFLYGMTENGGSSSFGGNAGDGTIFAFNTSSHILTLSHSFLGGSTDGANPLGSLLQSGTSLYGMTFGGGGDPITGSGNGTIFTLDTTNNSEMVKHFFAGSPSEGHNPYGSLIQSGTTLYGMTADDLGGVSSHRGTIFALNTTNNSLTVLHAFVGGLTDGAYPHGSLLQSGNILYGLTSEGGNGTGTLFAYNTSNNSVSVLHSFTGGPGDGALPLGSLIQSGNILYGTTLEGGANNFGTLFAFDTTNNTEIVLHSFTSTNTVDGAPGDQLVEYGNILIGTDGGGTSNRGAIFAFDTTTDSFSTLHSFAGPDGRVPDDLLLSGNTIYGTTAIGGTNSDGVLFSLTVPEPAHEWVLACVGLPLLFRRRRSLTSSLGRPLDKDR
jgi:uncharacterized repeat protein (TIGR03803 family)